MKDIVIVDDEKDIRTLLSTMLEDEGYQTRTAANSTELFDILKGRLPSIVLLDIWLKKSLLDGMDILHKLRQYFPQIDVVMISGHGNVQSAVRAMQIGACYFIEKPIKTDYLLLVLQRILDNKKLKFVKPRTIYNQNYDDFPAFLQGNSSVITSIKSTISRNIDRESRILLTGEVGTGKYNLAEYIHNNSLRKDSNFVAMRSNQKMDSIAIEKELFGCSNPNNPEYVGQIGCLEQAHMGTIYLEDIDLYPHTVQRKLVKFLADKKFSRFMSPEKIVYADVRVIASLSTSPKVSLENNLLLNDLYSRLGTVEIHMPTLKQRYEDIPSIIDAYAKEIAHLYNGYLPTFSEELKSFFQTHNWQYNLKEMRTLLKFLISDAYTRHEPNKPITSTHLPAYFKTSAGHSEGTKSFILQNSLNKPLREAREIFERDYLSAQLARFKGNISKTAQFVGMERSALHRKLRSLEIENHRENLLFEELAVE